MKPYSEFKLRKGEGITAIIINNKSVLVMKRIWLPLIMHPGLWLFVAGKKKRGEGADVAAYREIFEETGLGRQDLDLVKKYGKVMKLDPVKRVKFYDILYLFRSKTRRIRKNVENTAHRWASLSDIQAERSYTNVFADKRFIEKVIKGAMDGKKPAGR